MAASPPTPDRAQRLPLRATAPTRTPRRATKFEWLHSSCCAAPAVTVCMPPTPTYTVSLPMPKKSPAPANRPRHSAARPAFSHDQNSRTRRRRPGRTAAVHERLSRARPRRHDLPASTPVRRCPPRPRPGRTTAARPSKCASVVAATVPVMPPPTIATSGCIRPLVPSMRRAMQLATKLRGCFRRRTCRRCRSLVGARPDVAVAHTAF